MKKPRWTAEAASAVPTREESLHADRTRDEAGGHGQRRCSVKQPVDNEWYVVWRHNEPRPVLGRWCEEHGCWYTEEYSRSSEHTTVLVAAWAHVSEVLVARELLASLRSLEEATSALVACTKDHKPPAPSEWAKALYQAEAARAAIAKAEGGAA